MSALPPPEWPARGPQVLLLGRWLAAEADAFNARHARRAASQPEPAFLAAAAAEAQQLYARAFQELTRQARRAPAAQHSAFHEQKAAVAECCLRGGAQMSLSLSVWPRSG